MPSFSSVPSNSAKTPASRRRPLSMYGSDMSSANVMTTSAYDSLDDWGGTSVASSTPPSQLQRGLSSQNLEIIRVHKLNSEVALLKEQLAGRPTQEDLDEIKNEWQTTEELFAKSQMDNEKKHRSIELQRQYIKALEAKLEEVLGPDWKECCDLPSLNPQPFPATLNTPLPGVLNTGAHRRVRHSRNMSMDRGLSSPSVKGSASMLAGSMTSTSLMSSASVTPLSRSRAESGRSFSLRDYDTSTSSNDRLDVDMLLGAQLQPPSRPPPPQASPQCSTPISRDRVLEQVETLTSLIKSMPNNLVETVLEQLELNEAMRRQNESRKDALVKKEKEEEIKLTESKLERRNQLLLEMLDAAERRAEARELRLQNMLAEAKTGSGQMDW